MVNVAAPLSPSIQGNKNGLVIRSNMLFFLILCIECAVIKLLFIKGYL